MVIWNEIPHILFEKFTFKSAGLVWLFLMYINLLKKTSVWRYKKKKSSDYKAKV